MKIKVLYLSVRADWGGGPEHLYQLIRHSPDSLHAIVVCPDEPPYFSKISKLSSVRRMIPIPHRSFSLFTLLELCRAVRSDNVMLVHSHGKGAGLYSRLLAVLMGIPCVHTYHGVHVGSYGKLKRLVYGCYEKLAGLFTARGIAVSDGEGALLRTLGYVPLKRLAVIPNGVVLPNTLVDKGVAAGRSDVVTITRFDYQKNSEFIVNVLCALERKGALDKFRFVFIGTGEARSTLQREITERWGEDVALFVGTTAEPGRYLEKGFCYFSSARWEGLPLAVLEAMSYGLPVVASRVVGNEDAVSGNGLLYDLTNAEQAAEALMDLYNDEALWQRCSTYGRRAVAEKYSVVQMANAVWDIYTILTTR
ncbi:glycosyltransferase [Oleidesulfovibrio sp.]|uniref:glycosyltransferase n=1 Tax=Oleidesulfovibrio sp. TaxID=2909707 RepID=UPI003A845221